jgi:hypothetical protein
MFVSGCFFVLALSKLIGFGSSTTGKSFFTMAPDGLAKGFVSGCVNALFVAVFLGRSSRRLEF